MDTCAVSVPRLQDGLRKFADHPLVGEVRGVGLMAAVELVKDKATKEPFDAKTGVGAHLGKRAMEHGLIIRSIGDVIAFSPPLVITEEEIGLVLERFEKALNETVSWVGKEGLAKVA